MSERPWCQWRTSGRDLGHRLNPGLPWWVHMTPTEHCGAPAIRITLAIDGEQTLGESEVANDLESCGPSTTCDGGTTEDWRGWKAGGRAARREQQAMDEMASS